MAWKSPALDTILILCCTPAQVVTNRDICTKGHGESEPRTCLCGNWAGTRSAGSWTTQPLFTMKSLRRHLARQVRLSGTGPCLPSATPGVEEEKELRDTGMALNSGGSQLDLITPLPDADFLDVDQSDNDSVFLDFFRNEEGDERKICVTLARDEQPVAQGALLKEERGTPAFSFSRPVLLDVCKRAAAGLAVCWPAAVAKTARSHYKVAFG